MNDTESWAHCAHPALSCKADRLILRRLQKNCRRTQKKNCRRTQKKNCRNDRREFEEELQKNANTTAETMNLQKTQLNEEGAEILAKAFRSASNLTDVDLSENSIRAYSDGAIANALPCSSIVRLNMLAEYNGIYLRLSLIHI